MTRASGAEPQPPPPPAAPLDCTSAAAFWQVTHGKRPGAFAVGAKNSLCGQGPTWVCAGAGVGVQGRVSGRPRNARGKSPLSFESGVRPRPPLEAGWGWVTATTHHGDVEVTWGSAPPRGTTILGAGGSFPGA